MLDSKPLVEAVLHSDYRFTVGLRSLPHSLLPEPYPYDGKKSISPKEVKRVRPSANTYTYL